MPVPKQTTDLIFALRALVYRVRQLKKERRAYSKTKHRELAKLLKEGREDLAYIKTEDLITNDNLIAALEILELYCEQLHVRANFLDHLAFEQKRSLVSRKRTPERRQGRATGANAASSTPGGEASGWGWGIWKALGFAGSSAPSQQLPKETLTEAQPSTTQESDQSAPADEEQYDVYIEPELDQAAAVIFYCYSRLPRDIPGLPELRAKLIHRWGTDFANKAQDGDPSIRMPEELQDRLRIRKAPESLVENYLKEIARTHGIPFHGVEDEDEEEGVAREGDDIGGGSGGLEGQLDNAEISEKTRSQSKTRGAMVDELKEIRKSSTSQDIGFGENTSPSKSRPLPPKQAEQTKGGNSSESKNGGIPEVDELARRFAALKK